MKCYLPGAFGIVLLLLCGGLACAQKGPETTLTQLPQDHPYQRVLRKYMATLTAQDFTHGVTARIPVDAPTSDDPEYLYRQHLLTLMNQPLVGTKRGTPAVNAPPALFTLSAIETPKGVMQPMVWPETLIPFVQWDYPGNHYRNSRALKLRAFVGGAVMMIMFDNFAELNDGKVPPPIRPDWHGYNPVFFAAPYPGFKDVLPPEVRQAYEAGLKKVGERILGWGIRGETCESDLQAPLGLVYISRAINDPAFAKAVEERVRVICTDPQYVHPAGYWVERGGIDTGFGGSANLYAVWIALMTDWPCVNDAVARAYRLRGHLILPEPDGAVTGPSHFNSRLGSPASIDQFACDGARDAAAAMVTDEAAHFTRTPSPEELKAAPGRRAGAFNEHIQENPRNSEGRHISNEEITLWPWKLRAWMTYNFPISVNPAYEFYRKGAFARRQELEQQRSPLLKSPFLRGEQFTRDFEKTFVVTRRPDYAAILHTGPIGDQSPDDGKTPFKGPMGLSGGQLSAFWTPATGSVLLGLRSGMSYDKSFDQLDAWRTWPLHAVSGVTADGAVFTSARIRQPDTTVDIRGDTATVKVAGVIPAAIVGQEQRIAGTYQYARAFTITDRGVRVETTVSGDGQERVAELYETLPVYLRDPEKQPNATPTTIEFQVKGAWTPATDQYADAVRAVRLTRFNGAVVITFDKPCRARLAPDEWADNWFTKARSRAILIDLLEGKGPTAVRRAAVSYTIAPAAK